MKARCLFTFKGRQRDELSFRKGEVLEILSQDDGSEWGHARNADSVEGLIPMNLVEIVRDDKLPPIRMPRGAIGSQSAPSLQQSSNNNSLPPSYLSLSRTPLDSENYRRVPPPSKIPIFVRRKSRPQAQEKSVLPVASTSCDNTISADPSNPYGPDVGRYELILNYGCPFSARPWLCLQVLGLENVIRVVRTFPAVSSEGWFFEPTSAEEEALVQSHPDVEWDREGPTSGSTVTHLKQIYLR